METICIPLRHSSARPHPSLPPLMHQQPTLPLFLSLLLLLLPLLFSRSPPAPLSHRCRPGTEGTSKHHPNECECVCSHSHALQLGAKTSFSPLKNNRALTTAYICSQRLLAPAIAISNIIEKCPLWTFRLGVRHAQREPQHWYQLLPVSWA